MPVRRTPATSASSAPPQVERRPIVMAPGEHEREAQDHRGALEHRAQEPGSDTDLDESDHQHENQSDSVELPPRGPHDVLLLP